MDQARHINFSTIKFHTANIIPQIGLGTYQMRGLECVNAIKVAVRTGYRHIDTASIYKNEEDIASALKELYQDKIVTRQDLFITSKISPYEQGYDKALIACEDILNKLETPYLDCLIIHWPGVSKLSPESPDVPKIRLETWRALEKLREDGKVKDIGVSNFLVPHLEHLLQNSKTKPVLNQFELHPLCCNKDLITFCRNNGITVEAYSPLARNNELLMNNEDLASLAKKYKKTVPQIALRWGIQNQFVVLPKSRTDSFIKENIEIFDFELTEEEVERITGLNQDYHTCWDPSSVKN